ncbi:MAG: cation diffusion facilitator family transporter [Chloroflexota bacterium]
MSGDHGHGHSAAYQDRRSLVLVLGIGVAILVVELLGGIAANSLALLADAGHVLTDVAGVALALGAIWIAARPSSDERTYGWYRVEILAAVINAVLLFGVAAYVLLEAWQRWNDPPEVTSGLMLAVALLGGAANLLSMWLLRAPGQRSLNLRGAYLEVLGDFLGSIAVVVAAVVIALTGWTRADALASAAIGLMILPRTWSLLRDAIDVLLEATPKGLRVDQVRGHLLAAEGVADIHDLHAWTITSGQPVVSAHVVLKPGADPARVLDELCRCLSGDFDIEHSTLQLETSDRRRLEEGGHH